MKYLCLIYSDPSIWSRLSKTEIESMMAEYRAFTESIQESGQFVDGDRLASTEMASTVRVRDGKTSTTDGPFAETKEQLGGYYMIEARDLNEAIQVAARIPGARFGTIEVRPVAGAPPE